MGLFQPKASYEELAAKVMAQSELLERQHRALNELVEFIDSQNTKWEQMAFRVEAMLAAVIHMNDYLAQQQQQNRPIYLMHRGFEPE